MLRWLRAARVEDDVRAVCAALAICSFLWGLKFHFVWWMHSTKGIYALADVPARSVPLLAAQDLVFCVGLALLFRVMLLVANPLWMPARMMLGRVIPAIIGCAIALFAVVNWKVQQLYGCALEVAHVRAATGIDTMQDSIVAFLDATTVSFIVAGLALAIFGGKFLQKLVESQTWILVRWRLWAILLLITATAYTLDRAQIKERYTYGVEQNAVLHFINGYERAPMPVDVAELLHATPREVISRDAEFRSFAPFTTLKAAHGTTPDAGPLQTERGIPKVESGDAAPLKNVLIVLMESTSAMYVDRETAPNLARLADSGVRMDHHFTSICETYKAVYSLLFSDYMVDLGSLPRVVYKKQLPQTSLPQVLKANGYQTAFFHSGFLRLGDLGFMLKGFDTLVSADDLQTQGAMGWRYGVFEEHTVDAVSTWIRAHKDGPFLAVYSPMFPHHPYYSPLEERPFPVDTQVGRYRNALHYADRNVGTLIDLLRKEDLTDDTLVVVVADHGETVSSWPCGHGMNFSMEELHVPLILSNPKRLAAGSRSDLFTQHPDVAPTILGLLGVDAPAQWLGRDLSRPLVPRRAFPVKVEQAHFSGIVDNGLVYRLDEKSGAAALLRIENEQFVPVAPNDGELALSPGYADRLSLFSPWVRWRHFSKVMQPSEASATLLKAKQLQ